MAYGLKYVTQFDSQTDAFNPSVRYTLQFLFKDYIGSVISIEGATTTVLQKCTIDDPLTPIKGSSLDIALINAGNLPITSFYADNDSDIMVTLLDGGLNTIWTGFLVQDDCHEIMVDYEHEIQLSANDNLGLLKDVPLDQAPASYQLDYDSTEVITTIAPNIIETDLGFGSTVVIGDQIHIYGTAQAGYYTVLTYLIVSGKYQFTVVESIGNMGPVSTLIGLLHKNLVGNVTLLSLIKRCLSATNLSIITNIFCNIKEQNQVATSSHFDQTLIDPNTFISGDNYEDCYSVLTKILETFNCQLFQANGHWNIIHWFEIRKYSSNAIPGFVYDETMALIGTTTFDNIFNFGQDNNSPQPTVFTYSLLQSILRPYKFIKRTFNYSISKYLLNNFDLKQLGPLIRSYVSGANTFYEYQPTGFMSGDTPPHGELLIRVIRDTILQTEIDRYLVVHPPQGNFPRAARSNDIVINKGDTANFSAAFRINVTSSLPIDILLSIRISDGITTYFLYNNTTTGYNEWSTTFGYNVTIPPNTPATNWNQLDLVDFFGNYMPPFPISGILTIHYALASTNITGTFWKDMRLDYTSRVNESTKIIGQIHKQTRGNDIKNNSDTEIFIDDSPRNINRGTLLLNHVTGLIQDRTTRWQYNTDVNLYKRGQLFTLEDIIYRDKMRSKFEGGFLGLKQNALASLLTVLKAEFYPTKNYIFGLLTIDYKRNQFNGTLWEIWDEAEPDVIADYSFTYIYDTK